MAGSPTVSGGEELCGGEFGYNGTVVSVSLPKREVRCGRRAQL